MKKFSQKEATLVKLKFRHEYKGLSVRQNMLFLDGRIIRVKATFNMDENDRYPGECALVPIDYDDIKLFKSIGLMWIASGDVEEVDPRKSGCHE